MILFPALRTANRRDRWRPPFPAGSETLTLLRAPDCSSRVVKTCLICLRLNRVSDLQSRQAGHWPPRGPASLAGTHGPGAAGVLEMAGEPPLPAGWPPGPPLPGRERGCALPGGVGGHVRGRGRGRQRDRAPRPLRDLGFTPSPSVKRESPEPMTDDRRGCKAQNGSWARAGCQKGTCRSPHVLASEARPGLSYFLITPAPVHPPSPPRSLTPPLPPAAAPPRPDSLHRLFQLALSWRWLFLFCPETRLRGTNAAPSSRSQGGRFCKSLLIRSPAG